MNRTSMCEAGAGLAVLIMGAFVLFSGGFAVGAIIKYVMEAAS